MCFLVAGNIMMRRMGRKRRTGNAEEGSWRCGEEDEVIGVLTR